MRYIIDALSKTMPVRLRDPRRVRFLSKREAGIAGLVAEGLNNDDIALQLEITEHTVRNNLFHIFEKLGVSTRVELVLYWLQQQANASSAEFAIPTKEVATAD
ncbi:MAG: response regulator transcription factor [Candidatus Acidiferrales bacterium]